ncbi:MAG TPA: hypothetical protein VL598_16150 [Trinickia sp.]|uniref:hypothetical protein n=1 Tax=Trinickia sp. TaxID=2571163 RepID=UPI002C93B22C|nr:hypothetical protein [Trinickia sp.]HTI19183.1 hypothetical protein [Trinickia sp.]
MDDLKLSAAQRFLPATDASASATGAAAFAHVLASVETPSAPLNAVRVAAANASAASVRAGAQQARADVPVMAWLARGLDELEGKRVEAAGLPASIVQSHARGASGSAVVLAMHRQARIMAAYHMDVMWAAKVVGATAGGLKQLIAST